MDINSLLSPQDSPARETPPPHPPIASPAMQSPSKRAIRQVPSRTPSGLSQQVTSSPQLQPQAQPPQPQHLAYHPVASPSISGFANGHRPIHSATSTPPMAVQSPRDAGVISPHPPHRQTSTPGMDALAGTEFHKLYHEERSNDMGFIGSMQHVHVCLAKACFMALVA